MDILRLGSPVSQEARWSHICASAEAGALPVQTQVAIGKVISDVRVDRSWPNLQGYDIVMRYCSPILWMLWFVTVQFPLHSQRSHLIGITAYDSQIYCGYAVLMHKKFETIFEEATSYRRMQVRSNQFVGCGDQLLEITAG